MSYDRTRQLFSTLIDSIGERTVWLRARPSGDERSRTRSRTAFNDAINILEPIMVSFQSLLIWEKPYVSAVAFIAFNIIFWLTLSWSRRFYSIFAIILFCYNFLKLWTNYIWPEIRVPPNESNDSEGWTPIHPQILSAPEISRYINDFIIMLNGSINWLINLRQSNHGLFCLLISGILTMTAIIGKIVPGVVIVYALFMTLALGPGIALYVIPHGWYTNICSYLYLKTKNDDDQSDGTGNAIDSQTRLNNQQLQDSSLNGFNSFELNPFDMSDQSSLQLLDRSQLETSLDKELSIEVELNNDESLQLLASLSVANGDRSPTFSDDSNSHTSSAGINFVSTHFSRNSSTDGFEDEYELISESEIQDSPKRLPKESSI